MNLPRTNWQELSREANKDRRRENRVALTFPIEVCGFNRFGRFFTERTTTHDISDGGCKFRLRTEIETEAVLAIRVIARRNGKEIDSRPTLFQVMWLEKKPEGWTLGTMKLQPVALWPVEFPERITSNESLP
jgi:hypothetical protein